MQKFISTTICALCLLLQVPAQTLSKEAVMIETGYGNITLRFYEETPLHKANFLKLVNRHFYDSLLFHRVILNFMIQGGDSLSRLAKAGDSLGHGDIGYTVPAEIRPGIFHKKGALCAAREGDDINPTYASSASQFYIVMGKKRTPEDLKKYEDRINTARYTKCARAFMGSEAGKAMKQQYNRLKNENKADSAQLVNAQIEAAIKAEHLKTPEYKFTPQQVEAYTTVGGTPHLDGTYTVFGQVTEGLDVIDKIAAVKTDARDRPLKDIRMKIKLVN